MNKKRLKKMIAVVLTMMLAIAVSACGSKADDTTSGTTQVKEVDLTTEAETDASTAEAETDTEADTTEAASSENADAQETHVLVAYFSATHTTEGVAKTLADVTGADLYEITPEEPYTDADLDYNDNNSRTTKEMNDPSARPAIAGSVENMDQYDIVFVGYPIWWGEAAWVVDDFVTENDFTGKTVIPFATSASSGIGTSASDLAALSGTGNWLEGKRFSSHVTADEIADWLAQLE